MGIKTLFLLSFLASIKATEVTYDWYCTTTECFSGIQQIYCTDSACSQVVPGNLSTTDTTGEGWSCSSSGCWNSIISKWYQADHCSLTISGTRETRANYYNDWECGKYGCWSFCRGIYCTDTHCTRQDSLAANPTYTTVIGARYDFVPIDTTDWDCQEAYGGCWSESRALLCKVDDCYLLHTRNLGIDSDASNFTPQNQGNMQQTVPDQYKPNDWQCARDKCWSQFQQTVCSDAVCYANSIQIASTRADKVKVVNDWKCDKYSCHSFSRGLTCTDTQCKEKLLLGVQSDPTNYEVIPGKTRSTEFPVVDDWNCYASHCWSYQSWRLFSRDRFSGVGKCSQRS